MNPPARAAALMSGDEYRHSLRRYSPTIFVDGRRVDSVADEPSFGPGINAIAHAVEALYAREANPVTSLLAEQGIATLAGALPGIVRGVEWDGDSLVVSVTPTYSGCPATDVIAADIEHALHAAGVHAVRIKTRLSPPWTTDWLSADARQRLHAQ